MTNKACRLLREIDDYFNDEIVDEGKFNNSNLFTYKCPIKGKENKCTTNNERINALGVYLYQNLPKLVKNLNGVKDDDNRHVEFFMMWLGDKLFKIEKNYVKTLEESYKTHLEKYTGNYKYWNLLDSKKEYKRANVWNMSELYSLLIYICKLITEYEKNPKSKQIETISNSCHQKFKVIYNDIKDCYSYFHLLKNLKNIYDGFRNVAIKNSATSSPKNRRRNRLYDYVMNASTIPIVELTTIDWNKRFPDQSDKILDFNTQKCVELNTETTKKQQELESKKKKKAEPHAGSDKSGNKNSLDRSKHTKHDQSKKPANTGTPKQGVRLHQRKRKQKANQKKQQGTASHPPTPQALKHTPPVSAPAPTEPHSLQPPTSPQPPPPQIPAPPESQPQSTSSTPVPSQQPGSLLQSTDLQKINPLPAVPPASASQDGSSLQPPQTGGSSNPNESKDSGNDKGSTGGANDNTGSSSSGNENPSGGSSGPTSSTSGGSFNLGSSIFEFILKGNEYYNKASELIEQNQQKFKDAKDQISNVYKNTVGKLKSAYSVSSSYLSEFINNVTSQLNQVGSPNSGGNQPGSGGPLGGGNPSNHSQQNPKQPENPLPSLPPSPSLSQTLPDPQTPSNPPSPKSIDPQPIPTSIQQIATTDGNKASQTSSSGQGTLSSSSTDPSTQGNGSTTVTVVKMNEKPSIWCIGSNNKCDITGISIIVISISIILTIMYKYLSLGRTSKSKRKKSIKKVINSIGGKRPIQIIIKSYDRKKDLKPVINSVDRKKDPLLNIYKLMQADPIPFINLFFLLIFFVYKRKYDFLEL
ncbi:CIR protein PIR protein [Plasmodium vinckei brucechwatti]|uniref:CIR protein PIR protein n=1 Tax=Plasmodium vinckei brucechwatti TaxID=119398 RepID=A0A6V7S5N0_PLAVN|nr:CIR protein PIR protein [Plasmodium vinckei brucechwatti]